jgi:diaminohydroxyphosphoribosylaminopyrimidine deaminase/5-amino-6-(5-phosphoribosylamino)uracil reductase
MGERPISESAEIRKGGAKTYFLSSRDLTELAKFATENNWNRILVEAGPTLSTAFLRSGLVDEVFIYQAPSFLGGDKSAVTDLGITNIKERIDFDLHEVKVLGSTEKNLRIHLLKRGA